MKEFIVFNDIQRTAAEIKGIFMTVWTLEKSICIHVPVFEVFGPAKRKYNKWQWMNESINEWMKFILTQ